MTSTRKILSVILATLVFFSVFLALPVSAFEPIQSSLPTISIVLDNNVPQSAITKDEYLPAVFTLDGNGEFDDVSTTAMKIKGRGNATWQLEKKPYNIKFDSKIDLLGMGKSKSWSLIANYYDKTHLRNYLTFSLGKHLGMTETTDCRYVNLYVNNSYYGMFLLTEKIQAGTNRVEIDTDTGSTLFEIEMAYRHESDGHSHCIETAKGTHILFKDPEYGDFKTEEEFTALKNTVTPIIQNAENSLSLGYDQYSQYIDVESFVNWYLISEFVKNYDSAFVTSDYFWYDTADGKLHMGPLWDYDTPYGNQDQGSLADCIKPEGYHVRKAPWFKDLTEDPDFMRLVRNKYTDLRNQGVLTEQLFDIMDRTKEVIYSSVLTEQARWPNELLVSQLRGGASLYTYSEEFAYMKNWITKRVAWLDTQWNYNSYAATWLCNADDKVNIASITAPPAVNQQHTVNNLFDMNTFSKYCAVRTSPTEISWSMTEPVKVTSYAIATANDQFNSVRTPVTWKFYCSSDGVTWKLIDSRSQQPVPSTFYTFSQYIVSSPQKAERYKIVFEQFAGEEPHIQIGELALGCADLDAVNDVKKYSSKYTAETFDPTDVQFVNNMAYKVFPLKSGERELVWNDLASYGLILKNAVKDVPVTDLLGDADMNSTVNATDALYALKCSIKKYDAVGQQFINIDYDCNKIVNSSDALLILKESVRG